MSSSIRNAASLFATAASLLLLPAVVQAQNLCPNCTIPSGESTTAYRQDGLSPYYPTVEDFVQTISGGTAPSGTQIAEASAQTGSDTCWSKYSPYSAVLYTSGGYWPIGTASPTNEQSFVSVGPNQWGPDLVGYLGGPARWYLVYNPQYGKSIPCGFTIYQSLYYICPNGVETGYGYAHALTSTITTSGVKDCRADISNNQCSPVLANTDSLPGDPSGSGGTGGAAVMGNPSDDYLRQGVITHTGTHAVVAVDQPRPLYSAVHTIREEYGWLVDYEDPRYDSKIDLKDATSPHWRASHPESPAVLTVAGGRFTSGFEDDPNLPSNVKNRETIQSVTEDYSRTSNPGRFNVRFENDDRVSVIGSSSSLGDGESSVLDAQITEPQGTVDGLTLLNAICNQLSKARKVQVSLGTVPTNLMQQTAIQNDGVVQEPAREALKRLSRSARFSIVWTLLWEPNAQFFALNIDLAGKTTLAPDGTRVFTSLKLD